MSSASTPPPTATQLIAQAQTLLAQAQTLLTPAPPPPRYTSCSDRVVRPLAPPPPLGPAPFPFADPLYSSAMIRVTDATTAGSVSVPGISFRSPSNPAVRGWACDSSAFWMVCADGNIRAATFDASTHAVTVLPARLPFSGEPAYSDSDPTILIGAGSAYTNHVTLVCYNVPAGTATAFVDLSALAAPMTPAPANTYTNQVMIDGGTLVCLYGGAVQDAHYLIYVRDMATGAAYTLNSLTEPGLGFHLHSIEVDKYGRYLTLYPANADVQAGLATSQIYVWDLAVGGVITEVTAAPDGHVCSGYGLGINQDVASGTWDAAQWVKRSWAAPNTPLNLISPVLTPPRDVNTVFFGEHSCWHGASPTTPLQPVISATYLFGVLTPWRAWDGEVIAIATDGTGTVWRFCQHQSNVAEDGNQGQYTFVYTPRPNVSPDGNWAVTTSNWQKTLGTDPDGQPGATARTDVFLVALT
jgi:hypothetical protein